MNRKIISSILALLVSFNCYFTSVQAMDIKNIDDTLQYTIQKDLNSTSDIKEKIMLTFEGNKENKNYKSNEVLVKLKGENHAILLKSLEKNYDLKLKKTFESGVYALSFDDNKHKIDQMLSILNNDFNVEYAEPNYAVQLQYSGGNEPYFNKLWGLNNTTTSVDINVEAAWDKITMNSDVVVGVVDTGIDYNHEDLSKNIWTNTNEVPDNDVDDDNNGYVDDYYGWDFINNDSDPYDDNGHGTHISGTIAAENNGIGVIGVAPMVKVMALKVADKYGNLYKDEVIDAINYGLSKGVRIFNCSFSGVDFSQSEYDTMKNANALFISASGNEGVNTDYIDNYPANYDLPNIISVGAIDKLGNLSSFSNYGLKSVDIVAPGSYILSTMPKGYGYYDGTSMAAPHVTGIAALALSENPNLTPANIREYILATGTKLSQLQGKISTAAIVDAGNTIAAVVAGEIPRTIPEPLPEEENPIPTPTEEPKTQEEPKEAVLVGWVYKDNNRYFYKEGKAQIAWNLIDGKWYYFNNQGVMQRGWRLLGGVWYYLDESGVMATGWRQLGGLWYYMDSSGAMATGWRQLGGIWYYMDNSGAMGTGWRQLGGTWYYLDKSGAMVTGWKQISAKWYYFNKSGGLR
ncbi:S8 family serine peptidase [Clostridium sp.]|uniref:S8 family serine peptidase n=1 Tax=Clostridium sp. TaxID=1506 RepID=UPI002FCC5F3C